MSRNSKTAFQIGAESLGKILHPRKHTQAVDDNIKNSRAFLESFTGALSRAAILLGDDASDELRMLIAEAKCSDPMSNEETASSEETLSSLVLQIESSADNGECRDDLISRARKYLAIRNQSCLRGKKVRR